jgi:glyoxylate reductase
MSKATSKSQNKTKIYITTPVFEKILEHEKVPESRKNEIRRLWKELRSKCEVRVSEERFPNVEVIERNVLEWGAQLIGCHLSHPIPEKLLKDPRSKVAAVCTSTAGYNHIALVPGVLITHTPGVLHKTVADFTIALILGNLRNLINLHNFVWNEEWKPGQKWDLDENLNLTMDNLTLGIAGMGEIGREVTKRLAPWGMKIFYYDIKPAPDVEKSYSNVSFVGTLEELFTKSDIVSLHIPLMPATTHIVGEKLLKLMKKNALLINTARGPIIDFKILMDLLEKKQISINLAFDVYEDEPIKIEDLQRFKKISDINPHLRFIFIPHNASADADTRAQMAIMILEDLLALGTSKKPSDLSQVRIIPEQRYLFGGSSKTPDFDNYRISKLWTK